MIAQMVFPTQRLFDVVTPETFDNLFVIQKFSRLERKKGELCISYLCKKNKNLYFIQFCLDQYRISSVS